MKVYLLYDYEEHGPERLKATLNPENLHRMLDAFDGWGPVPVKELHDRLDVCLAEGGGNLHDGYGGLVLKIVELE